MYIQVWYTYVYMYLYMYYIYTHMYLYKRSLIKRWEAVEVDYLWGGRGLF